MKSQYVCGVCGVSTILWVKGWKHATGGRGPATCGRPPRPTLREDYDREMAAIVSMVRQRSIERR